MMESKKKKFESIQGQSYSIFMTSVLVFMRQESRSLEMIILVLSSHLSEPWNSTFTRQYMWEYWEYRNICDLIMGHFILLFSRKPPAYGPSPLLPWLPWHTHSQSTVCVEDSVCRCRRPSSSTRNGDFPCFGKMSLQNRMKEFVFLTMNALKIKKKLWML